MDEPELMALLVGAKSAVRSVQCTGTSRHRSAGPGVLERESTWTMWQTSDGWYRVERPEGTVTFDGQVCWFVRSDGMKAFKNPAPLPSLLDDAITPSWLHPGVSLTDLGGSDVAGRRCRTVEARTPDGDLRYSLSVDEETGLILKSRDDRTGREFELDDVILNQAIDESRFRPALDPAAEVVEPPTRLNGLVMLAKAGMSRFFRR